MPKKSFRKNATTIMSSGLPLTSMRHAEAMRLNEEDAQRTWRANEIIRKEAEANETKKKLELEKKQQEEYERELVESMKKRKAREDHFARYVEAIACPLSDPKNLTSIEWESDIEFAYCPMEMYTVWKENRYLPTTPKISYEEFISGYQQFLEELHLCSGSLHIIKCGCVFRPLKETKHATFAVPNTVQSVDTVGCKVCWTMLNLPRAKVFPRVPHPYSPVDSTGPSTTNDGTSLSLRGMILAKCASRVEERIIQWIEEKKVPDAYRTLRCLNCIRVFYELIHAKVRPSYPEYVQPV